MASLISPPCSPNMGEALAAQLAILVTRSLSLDKFILKGDSLVVIQVLNTPFSYQDWKISPVIMTSLYNIPSNSLWEAKKININANFCAHSVARWAVARSHSGKLLHFTLSIENSANAIIDFSAKHTLRQQQVEVDSASIIIFMLFNGHKKIKIKIM